MSLRVQDVFFFPELLQVYAMVSKCSVKIYSELDAGILFTQSPDTYLKDQQWYF